MGDNLIYDTFTNGEWYIHVPVSPSPQWEVRIFLGQLEISGIEYFTPRRRRDNRNIGGLCIHRVSINSLRR